MDLICSILTALLLNTQTLYMHYFDLIKTYLSFVIFFLIDPHRYQPHRFFTFDNCT